MISYIEDIKKSEFDQAIQIINNDEQLHQNYNMLCDLGNCYNRLKLNETALSWYRKASELEPNKPYAYFKQLEYFCIIDGPKE